MALPTPTLIARTKERELLRSLLVAAQKHQGTMLCLSAESGYGKSMLLDSIVQETRSSRSVDVVRVECQAPIGALNLASIQPMQPWVKALELLMEINAGSAKKRLAVNIGLSVLGLIPIAGSIFDMTKEVMRDLREYRADKRNTQDATQSGSKLFQEFYEALDTVAKQNPLCVMIDDAQWMDAQSVEFLDFLLKREDPWSFSVVLSYQHATVETKNPALTAWLRQHGRDARLRHVELKAFGNQELREALIDIVPKKEPSPALEDWLLRRSAGIPITVMEYVGYFSQHSPFRADASLDADLLNSHLIPASLQALFARNIEQLSEEDVTLLALCSAEGRECSVFVISQLMNLDTLSTIKRLKSLQYRTAMIRSTGAHARYGVKTTIYEFTQALHHSYFHATLEMEERIELHERIAAMLQKCYRETDDELLQRQLAPYIAAHALEAGDEATARRMLVHSAKQAEESGAGSVMSDVLHAYTELQGDEHDSSTDEEDKLLHGIAQHMGLEEAPAYTAAQPPQPESSQLDIPDCSIVREDVVQLYYDGQYDEASERVLRFVEQSGSLIRAEDHALLLLMAARADIEAQKLERAESLCHNATVLLDRTDDDYARCVLDNVLSTIQQRRGNMSNSIQQLRQAAQRAMQLSDDLKLLTISNISLALKPSNQRQARIFERIARQLSSSLRFQDFISSVFKN